MTTRTWNRAVVAVEIVVGLAALAALTALLWFGVLFLQLVLVILAG